MNEHDLMTALEERADDVRVGPAPLDSMTRTATRTRRRNGVLAGVAAVAVVAVAAVGVAQVLPDGTTSGDDGGPDVAVAPPAVDVPPAGSTYVALGRAAIAVPLEWAAGDTECNGVPRASTYVVDPGGAFCAMFSTFPDDTDGVFVSQAEPDTSTWTPVEVDGVEALRSPAEQQEPDPALGGSTIHGATVYLPDLEVGFRVQSTVSADRVDELLAGIVVLDEHAGVPGFMDLNDLVSIDSSVRPVDEYVDRLEAAGLQVELVEQTDRRRYPPGTVISVDPVPGTLLDLGSTVRVTAAP